MATEQNFKISVETGSEEILNTSCTPCSESGRTKEADKFCVECGSHFCAQCLLEHNKFPALRSHQVLDKTGQSGRTKNETTGMNMPTERCSVHNGKLIDMFCKDHDKVCCSACVAIKHRACEHVESLPDIAKGIQDSKVYTDTKTSLQNVLTRMEKERDTRKDKLRNVDQQKDKLLEDIDALETELIRKIHELSKTSKEQICSQHQRCKNKIECNLNVLENVISTATASVQNLLDKNECQLFMNVKTSKELIKDCEALLNDLSAGKTTEEYKFVLNHEIKRNLTSFGFVQSSDEVAQVVKKYDASLYGRFLINPKYCEITGLCVMDDGTLVIADNTNSQLKKLNETFAVEVGIDVRGKPYSTCKVGPNEVATVLYSQWNPNYKVLFVDVGVKMKPGTTFVINGQAASVSYDAKQDALFVCNLNQVSVYTKSGVLLRAYDWNEYGDSIVCVRNTIIIQCIQ
ncbi:tripartite motif-containing protein 29-like [Mercenaria mercenaria]|uniref:tripartite motif-containing protein 29-like n=1 Tax=Mercenaria mercenaria TaxID=6596 RepID=UPI00234F5E4B|nr:tripartite motif-containing protein 29-like [Mercenaria mercenaria]